MVVLVITSKSFFHGEVYTYLVSLNSALENSHLSEGKSMLGFFICALDHMLSPFLIIHLQRVIRNCRQSHYQRR